jgi:rod shape-determining protein MreD
MAVEGWHQAREIARMFVPALLTIAFIFISSIHFNMPGIGNFMPLLGAMAIIYWSTYWQKVMPLWFVFLLGLLQDVLYGHPLGVTALLYILLVGATGMMRKFLADATFVAFWGTVSLGLLGYLVLLIVVMSLYHNMIVFNWNIVLQWFFSVLVYPFVHKLFNYINTTFLEVQG